MRHLILASLLSVVVLVAAQWDGGIGDLPRDEFAGIYTTLLTTLIREKTPGAFQEHNGYLSTGLFFKECNVGNWENYAMYRRWLEQFVNRHSDPQIRLERVEGDETDMKMYLFIDVSGMFGFRQQFQMSLRAVNEKHEGWSIIFIDNSIGCF